jgi:hypothetical protein
VHRVQTDRIEPLERLPHTVLSFEKYLEDILPVIRPANQRLVIGEIRIFDYGSLLCTGLLGLVLLVPANFRRWPAAGVALATWDRRPLS